MDSRTCFLATTVSVNNLIGQGNPQYPHIKINYQLQLQLHTADITLTC